MGRKNRNISQSRKNGNKRKNLMCTKMPARKIENTFNRQSTTTSVRSIFPNSCSTKTDKVCLDIKHLQIFKIVAISFT